MNLWKDSMKYFSKRDFNYELSERLHNFFFSSGSRYYRKSPKKTLKPPFFRGEKKAFFWTFPIVAVWKCV